MRVVAPEIQGEMAAIVATARRGCHRRGARFAASDLDGVWLVVAAATPEVNREVADAAEPRRMFVNAVDDPANATAYLSGVVRRDGVTVAISTERRCAGADGAAARSARRAAAARSGDVAARARAERAAWRRDGVPMEARQPLLLRALNALYQERGAEHRHGERRCGLCDDGG